MVVRGRNRRNPDGSVVESGKKANDKVGSISCISERWKALSELYHCRKELGAKNKGSPWKSRANLGIDGE